MTILMFLFGCLVGAAIGAFLMGLITGGEIKTLTQMVKFQRDRADQLRKKLYVRNVN